jgi:hypothetical protein
MSRAKYIVGTAKELQAKPDGGEKWLASLHEKELPEVMRLFALYPVLDPKLQPALLCSPLTRIMLFLSTHMSGRYIWFNTCYINVLNL